MCLVQHKTWRWELRKLPKIRVLGVPQQTGSFRINSILNHKTAVPWFQILTLNEISVDLGPVVLLQLLLIACLFNVVLHGFIYGSKMLTDQRQRLYLHETVLTFYSRVSVQRMQFLFSPNLLQFFSEVYNIMWTSFCLIWCFCDRASWYKQYSAPVESELQSAFNRCTVRLLTESDDTRCCKIQFWPPEDEHSIARNMSRHLM
jgi:hypothetical protein